MGSPKRFSLLVPTGGRVRADIQALRALAVTLVVVYHLAQQMLPGGYVGVDVFFVISGFLITSHLASSMRKAGKFSLLSFYAKRIRRLIPASLLVLASTLVGVVLFVPNTYWNEFGRQIMASAFYIQNWLLAGNSIDYSAPRSDASPLQHFWSLSVEEQFYLIWPVLMMLLVAIAARTRLSSRTVLIAGLSVLVAASLAYSVVATNSDPNFAYFVTTTRAWEFGAGGLLALIAHGGMRGPNWLRMVASWAGIACILFAALTYSARTPFPGSAALLPVLGTLAVLYGGEASGRLSLAWIFRLRPIQYLGDISYSVYLWHWPLKVILPFAFGVPMNNSMRALVLGLTFTLAVLTKKYIEDRFRAPRTRRVTGVAVRSERARHPKQFASIGVILSMIAGAAMVAGPAGLVVLTASNETNTAQRQLEVVRANPPAGFGAATAPDSTLETSKMIVPAPIFTALDGFEFGEDGIVCQDRGRIVTPTACTYGDETPGAKRIALVGDSHAGQWTPALARVAEENGWQLTVFSRSGCAFVTDSDLPSTDNELNCAAWKQNAHKMLQEGGFSLVVTSALVGNKGLGDPDSPRYRARVENFVSMWGSLATAGVPLLAIRDNPDPTELLGDAPSCVAAHGTSLADCAFDRTGSLYVDPQVEAGKRVGVPVADLSDTFCDSEKCPSVIGGVLVYRNGQHITKTFNETQAPALQAAMARAYPELFESSGR